MPRPLHLRMQQCNLGGHGVPKPLRLPQHLFNELRGVLGGPVDGADEHLVKVYHDVLHVFNLSLQLARHLLQEQQAALMSVRVACSRCGAAVAASKRVQRAEELLLPRDMLLLPLQSPRVVLQRHLERC